jgi:hypothetical protein
MMQSAQKVASDITTKQTCKSAAVKEVILLQSTSMTTLKSTKQSLQNKTPLQSHQSSLSKKSSQQKSTAQYLHKTAQPLQESTTHSGQKENSAIV